MVGPEYVCRSSACRRVLEISQMAGSKVGWRGWERVWLDGGQLWEGPVAGGRWFGHDSGERLDLIRASTSTGWTWRLASEIPRWVLFLGYFWLLSLSVAVGLCRLVYGKDALDLQVCT